MQQIFVQMATSFGLTLTEQDGRMQPGCSMLPDLPARLCVKLLGLGGQPGSLGQMLDCVAISIDFQKQRLPHLSLQHILKLAVALIKGYDFKEMLDACKGVEESYRCRERSSSLVAGLQFLADTHFSCAFCIK